MEDNRKTYEAPTGPRAPKQTAIPNVGLRRRAYRPGFWQLLWRALVIVATNAFALWLLDRLMGSLSIDNIWTVLVAAALIGLVNGVIWPALSAIITPISVLTLGIGSLFLNAAMTYAVLNLLPGVDVGSVWSGFLVAAGVTLISALVWGLFAVNDDAWTDESMARRVARHRRHADRTDVPGVVFLQVDGLSRPVLEHALQAGHVPTLYRWLSDGHHQLASWETEWSSQTGVSQCGILHGSVDNLPAFRWYEKDNDRLMVSNHPDDAAEIQRRHSDGNGLLAHNGSSYGNLFTGDAERAVMVMSNGGKVREGKIGAGYVGYFARPSHALRTMYAAAVDMGTEWWSAVVQIRRGVEPRVHRGFLYAFLRVFTTVISRDVCVAGVLRDMAEGRASIYIDFLGYDEVSHHSGPERNDTMAVLRDLDRQIERIGRAAEYCPRPYRIVVLSDHGQTQGPCFADKFGTSIGDVVSDLAQKKTATVDASDEGKTESSAWLRPGGNPIDIKLTDKPVVLGSGNLSLVYLPGPKRRLTRAEIDESYPGLVDGLIAHDGIGFVLVALSDDESVALGANGEHHFPSGKVVGDDPLAPFGQHAPGKVAKVDRYPHVADLMINSSYNEVRDEVTAFEEQVGSHGGLGGNQMYPFVLAPVDMEIPDEIVGPAALHRVLKQYLVDVGQPVTVSGPHPEKVEATT